MIKIKHEMDMMLGTVKVFDIFETCVNAIKNEVLIQKVSSTDKEFHFQNWFFERIKEAKIEIEEGGRNVYPDFKLGDTSEGYEIKGLSIPGRDASFDCNSNPPSGYHRQNDVYYVFGRYLKEEVNKKSYPVHDLVICHGQLFNNHHRYLHKNKNVKCFGSYGDIMIRDRKMYVAPTPYAIMNGLEGNQTLIVPDSLTPMTEDFKKVGEIIRKEVDRIVVSYTFNLETNEITTTTAPNPNANRIDRFDVYRLKSGSDEPVIQRDEKDISQWMTI